MIGMALPLCPLLLGTFYSPSGPKHLTGAATTDFLESESIADGATRCVPLAALWHVLITGLTPIWPQDRTTLGGVPLGDVWPCEALKAQAQAPHAEGTGDELVPFHKLTGWTTYSLVEPIEKVLGWRFDGLEDMTGLPEYRNGACVQHRPWGRLASCSHRFCGARLLMFFSFPPSPLSYFWLLVLVLARIWVDIERWSPCGSRCAISQTFGHSRILLPLCVFRDPTASALAPSYSGVACDDSHRTVS